MPAPPADRDQREQRDPVANRGAPPREAGAQRVPLRRLRWWHRQTSALPGFGLTMGYTLVYLSLIVLIPLATLGIKSAELSWHQLWALASSERALASYRITFGASFVAALRGCHQAVSELKQRSARGTGRPAPLHRVTS